MTSKPASRNAAAITLAPRSCPSRPGLATSTRIFLWSAVMADKVPGGGRIATRAVRPGSGSLSGPHPTGHLEAGPALAPQPRASRRAANLRWHPGGGPVTDRVGQARALVLGGARAA